MVQSMKPGSVIVDMAAEQGGNCELTVPGEAVVRHGVTIIGYTDLASRLAKQSSTLYSNNLLRLTEELCKTKDGDQRQHGGRRHPRPDGHQGRRVTWPPPPLKLPRRPGQAGKAAARAPRAAKKGRTATAAAASRCRRKSLAIVFGVGALLFWLVGALRAGQLPVALHGVRAGLLRRLHGGVERHALAAHAADERDQRDLSIIAIGALVQVAPPLDAAGAADRPNALILGLAVFALVLTAVNMFGGFAVTRRMLAMFRK
jgi:NAD(P) transhydrogenase subunit alpha